MSDLIKTLKSSSTGDDVYPNIKEDNIPSGAVTSAKIGTSAVITGKINDGAVTTNKVNDGAITYEKLALALKNLIDGKASNYDLSLVQSALNTHVANTSNPHSVTKSQVGLGNVDNTSDASKPVSTATQTALDLKADKSTTYTKTEVDTALSGKASLSGDNTFTNKNTFETDVILPYNTDYDGNNLQSLFNDKQDKIYMHNLEIYGEDSGGNGVYLRTIVYNTQSTSLTISQFKTKYENAHLNCFSADSDGMQNIGNVIPSHIGSIDTINLTIEIYYYDSSNHLDSATFSSLELTDTITTL